MLITNLLTNMVLVMAGHTVTNTPAFQEYAFHTMFTNAQTVAANWHLDQSLITTNKVTYCVGAAWPSGMGGIVIFDNRYGFEYQKGVFSGFGDKQFDVNDTLNLEPLSHHLKDRVSFSARISKGRDVLINKWLEATNLFSLEKAKSVANEALLSIGIPPGTITLSGHQESYIFMDESTQLIPYYTFNWQTTNGYDRVKIDVSGITGTVAAFQYFSPKTTRILLAGR